ncbi:MAG: 3-dehydroquinate synthase [Alphaproteobacteria bacterium]
MQTKIVTVDLDSRSYDIYIGTGLLFRAAELLDLTGKAVFIITDQNVHSSALNIRNILLTDEPAKIEIYTLTSGEQAKSFAQAEILTSWLLDKGVSRNSVLIAIGGGVVGDLTGFCASIVMRGIPYIQIPTTLLAQVDSSVGGKTGINMKQGKNLVGSFYQPTAVIADLDTLKTLPRRELLAGYAEILKYALIRDAAFFDWLLQNGGAVCNLDEEAAGYAIEKSVRAKAQITQADERETGGQRALLNFGHTFGHVLETATNYDRRLLHGEAVSIGMMMAMDLSVRLGICSQEDYERVENHLNQIGLPNKATFISPVIKASIDDLIEIMKRDKKVVDGKARFIVCNAIGDAFVSDSVPEELVREVLKDSFGGEIKEGKGGWKSAFRMTS